MKLLNHHLIKYILNQDRPHLAGLCEKKQISHVKNKNYKIQASCDLKTRRNFSSDNWFSFYSSEQVGDVELDDVWFAYPSRPNDMVLRVN